MAKFTFFVPTDMSKFSALSDINMFAERTLQVADQFIYTLGDPYLQTLRFLGDDITYSGTPSDGPVPFADGRPITGGTISTITSLDDDHVLWRFEADEQGPLINAADVYDFIRQRDDSDFVATIMSGHDLHVGSKGRDYLYDSGGVPGSIVAPWSDGAGKDTLNGGKGADTMDGGVDDDVYIVDNANDVVSELDVFFDFEEGNTDQFIDTQTGFPFFDNAADLDFKSNGNGMQDKVLSSVSYTLPPNVEYLFLTGSANINATGNDDPFTINVLRGNSGDNVLTTLNGSDWVRGGKGADTIVMDDVLNGTDAFFDKVIIVRGESGLTASNGGAVSTNQYDEVQGFDLTEDLLDLPTTLVALDETVNGTDDAFAGDGVTLRSHRIIDGIIQFDDANTFSAGVTIDGTNLRSALDYLSKNFNKANHWHESVAFDFGADTFIFTEGGTGATTSIKDTLVRMADIQLTSLYEVTIV